MTAVNIIPSFNPNSFTANIRTTINAAVITRKENKDVFFSTSLPSIGLFNNLEILLFPRIPPLVIFINLSFLQGCNLPKVKSIVEERAVLFYVRVKSALAIDYSSYASKSISAASCLIGISDWYCGDECQSVNDCKSGKRITTVSLCLWVLESTEHRLPLKTNSPPQGSNVAGTLLRYSDHFSVSLTVM